MSFVAQQTSFLPLPKSPDDFIAEVRKFSEFGRETECFVREEIPYFVNEFWTSVQRQAHSLHEISYRACFKPQLPHFFIHRLTQRGERVYDPFMGRGTTPIQAALMGRRPVGNDINPLSTLLTRPRLRPVSPEQLKRALEKIDFKAGVREREDLLAFYHPETLRGLEALRSWLAPRVLKEERVADWINMVSLNRLSGHSPGFFSGRSMPPNQAVSIKAQLKINEKLGVEPPPRDIAQIILKKSRSLLSDELPQEMVSEGEFFTCDAARTPQIESASVALVVTSPPFLDVVQYSHDNWLRCWFAGIAPESVELSRHRSPAAWSEMVHGVLKEQARILRSGGYVAFEVGEVNKGAVLLEHHVWRAADGLAFDRLGVMINHQSFTKTANCWGIANGARGTNTNRIVLLRRH